MKSRTGLVVLSVGAVVIITALYAGLVVYGHRWSGFEFMIGVMVSDWANECFKRG